MLSPDATFTELNSLTYKDALGNNTTSAKPNSIIRIKSTEFNASKAILVKKITQ